MAQSYGLYHGSTGASNSLTVATLALARGAIMRNGVVAGSGTGGTPALAARVDPTVNLSVIVNTGDWWNMGYFAQSTGGTVTLALAANSSGSTRIDRIVAQIDTVAATASYVVVQGTPGSGAPAINTLGTKLQLSLAAITVANGATTGTTLVAGNVADERASRTVCGYAAPVLHATEHNPGGSDPLSLPASLVRPETMVFGPVGAAGAAGTAVVDLGWQTIAAGAESTAVPANYTMYVDKIGHITGASAALSVYARPVAGSGTVPFISSIAAPAAAVGAALVLPLVVQAGGCLFNNTTGGTVGFHAILVPASGKLIQVAQSITNAVMYTVPAGRWFVLTHVNQPSTSVNWSLQSNAVDIQLPGYTNTGGTVDMGGGSFLTTSVSHGFTGSVSYAPGLLSPLPFSPGAILQSTTATAINIHGYTWPQTG